MTTQNHRSDQCKIIWYQWTNDIADDNPSAFGVSLPNLGALGEANSFDISNHIVDFSFNKTLGAGSGTFALTLSNSVDWGKYLKAGQWFTVFLSGEGDLPLPKENQLPVANKLQSLIPKAVSNLAGKAGFKPVEAPPLPPGPSAKDIAGFKHRLRAICYITRPAIRGFTGAQGELDITYTITGKDLGICLDETELWFNFFHYQESQFKALASNLLGNTSRNLTSLMNTWFDAFYKPESIFGDQEQLSKSLALSLKQWILPKKMLGDLGLTIQGDGYFGDILGLKDFQPTIFENNKPDPLSGLQGMAYNQLKGMSQPEFHEFFYELDDSGNPKVIFRPIPWSIDSSGYPNLAKCVTKYKDLAEGKATSGNLNPQSILSNPLGALKNAVTGGGGSSRVDLHSLEVQDFDIAPDFHQRYNQFLVDSNANSVMQNNAISFFQKEDRLSQPFPFRNENSIKRHGFRPMHLNIKSYLSSKGAFQVGVFKDNPDKQFLLEANELIKDYWGQASDFYSGTFIINGKSDIRLGKALVTGEDLIGIGNMVFYLEGYTDKFTVDDEGNREWIQTLQVTRGMELKDLKAGSGFKDKEPLKAVGTFIKDGEG